MTRSVQDATTGTPRLGVGAKVLVALFAGSGTIHLVRPEVFEPIVPDALPAHRLLVLISGVAELACAAGMVAPPTRRAAGAASAALLVAIFPANVQMAADAYASWDRGRGSGVYLAGTIARLPLQLPLIWWAWRLARPRARLS